jgi:ligand-binding SRPBCC domain-containing protein
MSATGANESVTVSATTRLMAGPDRVFAFHADARNLPRLMLGPVRVLSAPTPSRAGDRQIIRLGLPPLAVEWHARIEEVAPPVRIVDVQERGPFKQWRHTHLIVPAGEASVLVDTVEFRLFPGRLGRLLDRTFTATALRLVFTERHRRTRRILERRPHR